jgi:hypothetical protein
MSFIEIYYYTFYKYYKLFKALNPRMWTPDMIAVLIMMNLIMFLILPIQFYYDIFSDTRGIIPFLSFKVIAVLIFILLIQWLAFWRNDNWKQYVKRFDQWPLNKNEKGGWIVAGVTILLLANFIVSLALDPPPGGWK